MGLTDCCANWAAIISTGRRIPLTSWSTSAWRGRPTSSRSASATTRRPASWPPRNNKFSRSKQTFNLVSRSRKSLFIYNLTHHSTTTPKQQQQPNNNSHSTTTTPKQQHPNNNSQTTTPTLVFLNGLRRT